MRIEFNPSFVFNVVGIFLAFSVLTWLYIWPSLRKLPRHEALRILALVHAFRFLGLSFLIPGVVSPLLPSTFSVPAAWGDFAAAVLALASIAAELGPYGIRTVCLHSAGLPGAAVKTLTNDSRIAESLEVWNRLTASRNLLNKWPALEDVGNMAAFFASDKAGVATGATVNLTGGMVND